MKLDISVFITVFTKFNELDLQAMIILLLRHPSFIWVIFLVQSYESYETDQGPVV